MIAGHSSSTSSFAWKFAKRASILQWTRLAHLKSWQTRTLALARRKAKTEEQDGHSKNWNHGRHGHDRDDDNGHYDNGDIHEYEADDDNHHPNYHDQSTSEHTWGFSAWQRCWRITSQRDATNALQDWSESGAWSRHDWH